jgi:type VI secretion system FHA domain protein
MELVLTVVEAPPGTQSLNQQYVLTTAGGTIGRAVTSTCPLPCHERVVSSQHATIQYQGGQYFLSDISKNGTEINGEPAPKLGDNPWPLANGDKIRCGHFVLLALLHGGDFAALPKGLESVDFLDNYPVSNPSAHIPAPASLPAFPVFQSSSSSSMNSFDANQPASRSLSPPSSDNLDAWLSDSPSSHQAAPEPAVENLAGWGSVAEYAKSDLCPIAAFAGSENDLDIFGNSPISPAPQAELALPGAWEDDEWWKGEGSSHHIIDPSAHVHISPVNIASPKVATNGSLSAHSAMANPFARSHQDVNAKNIDDVLNLPEEHQSFSPQRQQPSPARQIATPANRPEPAKRQNLREKPLEHTPANHANEMNFGELLGVNPKTQLPEAQLRVIGARIIRETVFKLMGLIRARTSIKNELRVQHTTLQAEDNNPLKFSVDGNDAINALFSNSRTASFMSADEAIRDSFDDLSDHQMAMMAGMQAAYEYMFKQFSPSKLEALWNIKGGLLANKRAAHWEAYKTHYQRMISDRESTYNQLFGKIFAKHYEQRLAELKSQRLLRRPSL